MAYQVYLPRPVGRNLEDLPREAQERLRDHIDSLADDPRPHGAVAMAGAPGGFYRIRVGAYRIIYVVNDRNQMVTITAIGHRKDIYRSH